MVFERISQCFNGFLEVLLTATNCCDAYFGGWWGRETFDAFYSYAVFANLCHLDAFEARSDIRAIIQLLIISYVIKHRAYNTYRSLDFIKQL